MVSCLIFKRRQVNRIVSAGTPPMLSEVDYRGIAEIKKSTFQDLCPKDLFWLSKTLY